MAHRGLGARPPGRRVSVGARGTLAHSWGELGPPKTPKRNRSVPLLPDAVTLLRKHRAAQREALLGAGKRVAFEGFDLIFPNSRGGTLSTANLAKRHFQPVLIRAGVTRHRRIYDLQHTHATMLMAIGINPKIVSGRLGHASVAMTLDTYSHVQPGRQEAATEALAGDLSSWV